jgi:spore germination cell wall hydrolase CwlJ-like protein
VRHVTTIPSRRGRRPEIVRRSGRTERNHATILALCAAIFLLTPTVTAYEDMTSLISGADSGAARWANYVVASPAGSIQRAEMPFVDSRAITGSIGNASVVAPGIGKVALAPKRGVEDPSPDEARVNRAEKEGRVRAVVPQAPPKDFNAGSLFQRAGELLRPVAAKEIRMAFVKPAILGKEVKIASTFHERAVERASGHVPAILASLVTNHDADVLATAYAPSRPDYADNSPFRTLLKTPDAGRFIPPAGPDDFDWVRQPLPPGVFSEREQRCLAAAIYFEARSEPLKGQAAVAQVVLNRVRNPAYPKTICGVVYQNENWRNRCQFSFACDGVRQRVRDPEHWQIAEEIAMAVTAGKIWLTDIGSSTHYHATYVHPFWAHTMERMKKIGHHVFYRTYGGGWS